MIMMPRFNHDPFKSCTFLHWDATLINIHLAVFRGTISANSVKARSKEGKASSYCCCFCCFVFFFFKSYGQAAKIPHHSIKHPFTVADPNTPSLSYSSVASTAPLCTFSPSGPTPGWEASLMSPGDLSSVER